MQRKYIKANNTNTYTWTHRETYTLSTTMASSKFAAHQSYTKYALNKQKLQAMRRRLTTSGEGQG